MRNYQRELDGILAGMDRERPKRLLLHACCAPCSSYVLEYLTLWFEITVFFYNPNIATAEEYGKRERELARLIREMPHTHRVELLTVPWDPLPFLSAARGLEAAPEGGERCRNCFRERLTETARRAREGNFDYFTTTLTISPLKNAEVINTVGEECAGAFGVSYLVSDFKKRGGYLRSIELSREYGLYRQDFCGCAFSKAARDAKTEKAE